MKAEQAIKIAAEMYSARLTLKSLCPDKFGPHCLKWQSVIKRVAKGKKITEMEALVDILEKLKSEPISQMWVMASYVEMIEPPEDNTNEQPTT